MKRKAKKRAPWWNYLERLDACASALDFCKRHRTFAAAWRATFKIKQNWGQDTGISWRYWLATYIVRMKHKLEAFEMLNSLQFRERARMTNSKTPPKLPPIPKSWKLSIEQGYDL